VSIACYTLAVNVISRRERYINPTSTTKTSIGSLQQSEESSDDLELESFEGTYHYSLEHFFLILRFIVVAKFFSAHSTSCEFEGGIESDIRTEEKLEKFELKHKQKTGNFQTQFFVVLEKRDVVE
jgi:hypothetical protein